MKTLKTLAAAGLIASSLALAPAGAQAQTAAPAAAAPSFDAYRVVAVTAGVIVGATAAAIVTNGVIIPVYAYVTGAGGGAMAGGGAVAGGGAMAGWGAHFYGAGYSALKGSMRLLGAVGGGFYADSWYTGR